MQKENTVPYVNSNCTRDLEIEPALPPLAIVVSIILSLGWGATGLSLTNRADLGSCY